MAQETGALNSSFGKVICFCESLWKDLPLWHFKHKTMHWSTGPFKLWSKPTSWRNGSAHWRPGETCLLLQKASVTGEPWAIYLLCKLWTCVLVLELCPASIIWTVPTFSKRPCLIARKEEEWLHYFDIQNWQTVFLCHLPVSGENWAPLPGFADTFHQQRVCKWAATLKSMP